MRVVSERELKAVLGGLLAAQPRVLMSGNFATPRHILALVDATLESYRLFALNGQDLPACRPDVVLETPFVGPGMRRRGNLEYLPMRLSLVPRLFSRGRPPDVVLLHTSLPRDGRVSLGIEVNILPAAVAAARRHGGLVLAQLNRNMPYTKGDGELELDLVDLAIEAEQPLLSPPSCDLTDVDRAIGGRITAMIENGSTLQLGIGRIPDSVLLSLGQHRGLGVWSEMISDGVLDLEHKGVLAPERPITASFLFGSPDLYRWADGNERLQMLRTETVNDPARIATNPAMTSINTAMQFDLFGQANASYADGHIYSGFGGQPDFVEGSLHSKGGHAVIALPSFHERSKTSTIVPALNTPATSFQHSMVVTENGCAEIFGRSQRSQVRLLIEETARPDVREALWEGAFELGLADQSEAGAL